MVVRHKIANVTCSTCDSKLYRDAKTDAWDSKHHYTKRGFCPHDMENLDKNGAHLLI